MFSCVFFIALAAMPMFLRTSVLVLAFSRASLWNSMVDNVPSIRFSCSSYRFFLFRAWRATMRKKNQIWLNDRDVYMCVRACTYIRKLISQVLFRLNNNIRSCLTHTRTFEGFPLPRLFFVPFFFAVMSSCSIFFSRNSCFLVNISSVSRSRWIASWGVGCFPPFPPLPNSFTNTDILVSTPTTIEKSPVICGTKKISVKLLFSVLKTKEWRWHW